MDPYGISPGKAADPFAFDPGPGFAPELSAAPREDSPFKHSSSPAFEAGGPAAPAFNAFGPTPSFQSGSSPFSAPPPVLADPAPAFVPRPAVLTFPGQKPL
jgi:hypothetical protein